MRVRALSKKAKKALEEKMNGNPIVEIGARNGNRVFFISRNGKYCNWASLVKDPNWEFIISNGAS